MTSVGHVPPINIILKGELAFGNEHNTQKSIFFLPFNQHYLISHPAIIMS